MFNNCINKKISRLWQRAHIIAIQKPDKDSSHSTLVLLCHPYKIFDRIILNRKTEKIDAGFINQQTGFMPSQILQLTKYVEGGFEK